MNNQEGRSKEQEIQLKSAAEVTPKRKQDSMSSLMKLKRRDENPLRDIGLPKDTAVYKYEEGVDIYGDYLTILPANNALPGVGGKYGGRS